MNDGNIYPRTNERKYGYLSTNEGIIYYQYKISKIISLRVFINKYDMI